MSDDYSLIHRWLTNPEKVVVRKHGNGMFIGTSSLLDNRDPVVVEARPAVVGATDEDVVDDLAAPLEGKDTTVWHWRAGARYRPWTPNGYVLGCEHGGPTGFPFFSGDVAGRVHLGEVNERLWVGW